jgi:hypothetical protein
VKRVLSGWQHDQPPTYCGFSLNSEVVVVLAVVVVVVVVMVVVVVVVVVRG